MHVYVLLKCPQSWHGKSPFSAPRKLNSGTQYFKMLSLLPALSVLGLHLQLLSAFAEMLLGRPGSPPLIQAAYKDNGHVCPSVLQCPLRAQLHEVSPPPAEPVLPHHSVHPRTPPTDPALHPSGPQLWCPNAALSLWILNDSQDKWTKIQCRSSCHICCHFGNFQLNKIFSRENFNKLDKFYW